MRQIEIGAGTFGAVGLARVSVLNVKVRDMALARFVLGLGAPVVPLSLRPTSLAAALAMFWAAEATHIGTQRTRAVIAVAIATA